MSGFLALTEALLGQPMLLVYKRARPDVHVAWAGCLEDFPTAAFAEYKGVESLRPDHQFTFQWPWVWIHPAISLEVEGILGERRVRDCSRLIHDLSR